MANIAKETEKLLCDFIQNKITFENFVTKFDDDMCSSLEEVHEQLKVIKSLLFKCFNSLKEQIDHFLSCNDFFYKTSGIYETFYYIVKELGFGYPYNDIYLVESDFYYTYIQEYLLSDETYELIKKEIVEKLPPNLNKKQTKEIVKEKCITLFHLEDNKRPYWAQESEWPVRNGQACKYINRKRDGDKVDFEFEDVVTGEKVIITQYY